MTVLGRPPARRGSPPPPQDLPRPTSTPRACDEVLDLLAADAVPGMVATRLGERRKETLDGLGRGVVTRLLCADAALADDMVRRELELCVTAGARVRVTSTAPRRLTVLDGRVAVVGEHTPADGAGVVVRDRMLVESLRSFFVCLWAGAVDLGDRPDTTCSERDRAVLRLLATGVNDTAAARTMEVSVRTYRRYVADTMALLGASSRYQAGVRAAQLGWLCPADPAPRRAAP